MKDFTEKDLENSRPALTVEFCINDCINQLMLDDEKNITDEVVFSLTYEELIGALLLARDFIEDSKVKE